MENSEFELTDEQLTGVNGGDILPDGRIRYLGYEFELSTEEDYEKVLAQFGNNFGPSIGSKDEEANMWASYYDWYYQKYGRAHGADNR